MSGSSKSVVARLEELESSYKDIAFLLCKEQRENAELKMEVSTLRRQVSTMEGEMERIEKRTSERCQVLNRVLVKAHENVDSRQEVLKRLEEVEDIVKTQSRKVSKLVEEFETRRPEERLSAQACAPPPRPRPTPPPKPRTPRPRTPTPRTPTPRTPTPSTPTPRTPTPRTPTPRTPTPRTPTPSTPTPRTPTPRTPTPSTPTPTPRTPTPTPRTPTPRTPTPSKPTPRTPTPSTPPAPPAKNLTAQEWKRLKEKRHFRVRMSLPQTIQGRTRQRVEGYDWVLDSDCFDRKTGVYKTPVFGPYIFNVRRCKSMKDGGVRFFVCGGDGRRKEVCVSRVSGGLLCQDEDVYWDCPEGLEVWVEVEAGRGGVGLMYQVVFDGWLNK